jgi:hypothetical protein
VALEVQAVVLDKVAAVKQVVQELLIKALEVVMVVAVLVVVLAAVAQVQ